MFEDLSRLLIFYWIVILFYKEKKKKEMATELFNLAWSAVRCQGSFVIGQRVYDMFCLHKCPQINIRSSLTVVLLSSSLLISFSLFFEFCHHWPFFSIKFFKFSTFFLYLNFPISPPCFPLNFSKFPILHWYFFNKILYFPILPPYFSIHKIYSKMYNFELDGYRRTHLVIEMLTHLKIINDLLKTMLIFRSLSD